MNEHPKSHSTLMNERCPDCECTVERHNAVTKAGGVSIAHCGGCGACWKSAGTNFVQLVRENLALPRSNKGRRWIGTLPSVDNSAKATGTDKLPTGME